MVERPDPAACDYRDVCCFRDRPGDRDIKTVLGSVGLHAGQQDLPGPPFLCLFCPAHRIYTGRLAPAIDNYLVPAGAVVAEPDRHGFGVRREVPAHVHGDHDALRTEGLRAFGNDRWIMHGARVQAHLVRPGPEDLLDIVKRPQPASNGQREEELVGRPLDEVDDDAPLLLGSGDIEEDHLVCSLLVVAPGKLHRVAGIPEPKEVSPFYHPAVL